MPQRARQEPLQCAGAVRMPVDCTEVRPRLTSTRADKSRASNIEGRARSRTMGVDSAALIKTLNKTCLNALQAAAGLCLSRTNPSVEVEHWLVKLVELPDSDLSRIFRHFEVDTTRLLRDLTRIIDGFRTGNQRTPTLSLQIDQLIRASWVTASIQYQARQVRSGTLLLALLDDEELGRMARDASRELAKIKIDQLQPNLMKLVAGSEEDEGPASGEAGP